MGLFLVLDLIERSALALSLLGSSVHAVVHFSIDFLFRSKWNAPFHRTYFGFSHADRVSFCDHNRNAPWEDIFYLGASAATSEFFERAHFGIDVYIPHRKHQVKPHSALWF